MPADEADRFSAYPAVNSYFRVHDFLVA